MKMTVKAEGLKIYAYFHKNLENVFKSKMLLVTKLKQYTHYKRKLPN
jgi:hypothetical protein